MCVYICLDCKTCEERLSDFFFFCLLLPDAHSEKTCLSFVPLAFVTNMPHTVKHPNLPYSVHRRSHLALATALKHSISICPVCKEISNGCSRARCVNPVMSKHFHYCSWQIWQLLFSNTELQLHLKGVWIETDYLGGDSELSLLSPQCNLLLFDGAALNSGSARQSLKTIPANVAVQAAFPRITNVPLHRYRTACYDWVHGKNAERWRNGEKKRRNGKWVRKVEWEVISTLEQLIYSCITVIRISILLLQSSQQSLLFQVMCVWRSV